jgi:hypothetical protein
VAGLRLGNVTGRRALPKHQAFVHQARLEVDDTHSPVLAMWL